MKICFLWEIHCNARIPRNTNNPLGISMVREVLFLPNCRMRENHGISWNQWKFTEFHEISCNWRKFCEICILREMSPPKSLIFDKGYWCFRPPGTGMCFLPPKHQNLASFYKISWITMNLTKLPKIFIFYGKKQVFAPGHENINNPLGIL